MAQVVEDGKIVEDVEEVEEVKDDLEEDVELESQGEEPEEQASGVAEEEKKFWNDIDTEDGEVPVSTHIRVKSKLKGKLKEKDDELETLKREIETLKKGPHQEKLILKRPDRYDFDTDDEYEVALDRYDQQRFDRIEQERQRKASLEAAQKEMTTAVDHHYERADKFVADYGISPERYQQADLNLKRAVENVMPDAGELVVNQLISVLGEGSEKVLFRVGAKAEELAKLQSLLLEDKSGIKVAVYLGEQKALLTNPKKMVSRAPTPSPQIHGDAAGSENISKQLRKYKELHKKGKIQDAYNLKKAARQAGADTSKW